MNTEHAQIDEADDRREEVEELRDQLAEARAELAAACDVDYDPAEEEEESPPMRMLPTEQVRAFAVKVAAEHGWDSRELLKAALGASTATAGGGEQ